MRTKEINASFLPSQKGHSWGNPLLSSLFHSFYFCSVRRSQDLVCATKVLCCWTMSPGPLIYSFIHFPSLLVWVPSLFLWRVLLKYRTYIGILVFRFASGRPRTKRVHWCCQLPPASRTAILHHMNKEGCALTCLLRIWYFYPTPWQPEKKIWLTCLKHSRYMKGCLDSVYT